MRGYRATPAQALRLPTCGENWEWTYPLPLGGALALQEQGPGSDDQRAIRARERASESLDGTPIRLGGRPIL